MARGGVWLSDSFPSVSFGSRGSPRPGLTLGKFSGDTSWGQAGDTDWRVGENPARPEHREGQQPG